MGRRWRPCEQSWPRYRRKAVMRWRGTMASLRNWMQKVSDDSDEAITEFRQAVHQATAFFTHGLSSLTSGAEWRPWHCVAGGRHAAAAGAARGAAPAGDQVACGARGFLQRGNQDAGRVPRPPRVGRAGPEAPRGAGRLQRAGISRHGCRLWRARPCPRPGRGSWPGRRPGSARPCSASSST